MNSKEELISNRTAGTDFGSELEWLIFYLWLKPAFFKFKIPDTVILKRDKTYQKVVIDNWYFTSGQGHVLKKNRCNCTI